MAMYGNIPRNTKEYINSASDKANISYEFEIGSKDFKRRYIVDRTIKRTKTGGILTSHCRLVEIHNDEQSIVLNTDKGNNTILINNSGIKMIHADCKDELCIKQGTIKKVTESLVCLPHELIIEIKGEESTNDDDIILSH